MSSNFVREKISHLTLTEVREVFRLEIVAFFISDITKLSYPYIVKPVKEASLFVGRFVV